MIPTLHTPPSPRRLRFRNALLRLSIFLLLCGAALSLRAQQGSKTAFSLNEAVDFALNHNASVQNAKLDETMSQLKTKEVLGLGLPQVNGSFDFKDFIELPTSLIPAEFFGGAPGTFVPLKFGTQYNATANVQVSQLVFNSDFFVGVTATRMLADLAEVNVQRTQIEVKTQVTKAYYNALVNTERLKLLDINTERLGKLLEDTRALNTEGFVEGIDVERLEVTYNNLIAEKEKITRLAGLAVTLLKFQMGYDVTQPLTLTDKLDLSTVPVSAEATMPKPVYSNRTEFKLLQTQHSLNEVELRRYKLSYLPSAFAYGSLSAQYQANNLRFTENEWFPIGLVGLTIQVPIFDGFQKSRRIQQAKFNIMKTENNIRTLEDAIDMETTVAWANYQNAIVSLNTQKKNIELATHVYEVTQVKFREGVGSNIEMVNAESSFKEAQTNYMNAIYDYYVSKVDLEKALGLIK